MSTEQLERDLRELLVLIATGCTSPTLERSGNMPNDLEAKMANLKIRRVRNGWVIHGDTDVWGGGRGEYHQGETVVARTPAELADQVRAWAERQQDVPPVAVDARA